MKLEGKTLIVTGASSGIGKAVALRCAQDKCTIILASRNKEKLEKVAQEVQKLGSEAVVIPTDVAQPEEIKNLFLKATEHNQTLDFVFNNAGLGFIGNIWELKTEEITQMINVNTLGMILVTKYASEVMVRQQHGHIIMTSSLAGLITLPQWSVYAATKWAITGFADSIRHELKPKNVKVSTLHPGAVKTEFFSKDKANIDIKTVGDSVEPEEVANAVYDAIFTNKNKIIIPSMAKSYSMLYKYFPAVVDKMLEKQVKEIKYHDKVDEDEPEFSYVKCVTCK